MRAGAAKTGLYFFSCGFSFLAYGETQPYEKTMIKLEFTHSQIHALIKENSNDRLADMLLEKLAPDSALEKFTAHVKSLVYPSQPCKVATNKIFWIKELRDWSRNRPDLLALFEPRHAATRPVTTRNIPVFTGWCLIRSRRIHWQSMTIIRELTPQNSAFWYFYFQKIGWPWQI